MDRDIIQKHSYIKLVEFALSQKSFSVREACDATGLTEDEFAGAKYSLFLLKGAHENIESVHESLQWRLKPETYFSYISYLEFKHSLSTSKRAWWFSTMSLSIAAASLFFAVYGIFWK